MLQSTFLWATPTQLVDVEQMNSDTYMTYDPPHMASPNSATPKSFLQTK